MDQTPTLFEKKGFGGSFTDNVYSNNPMLCAYNDNLLVNNNEKYFLRPGSLVYLPAVTTVSATVYRISHFFKFKDESALFVGVGPEIYRMTGSAYTLIQGPFGGTSAFTGFSDGSNYHDYTEWRGHLFITSNLNTLRPIKIFQNGSGTWSLRTGGMPVVPSTSNYTAATLLASTIVIANHARTALLAHYANTSAHPVAHTAATNALTAPVATNLVTLEALVTQLLSSYTIHADDMRTAGANHYTHDTGGTVARAPLADMILSTANAPETLLECVTRLNDLISKWGAHVLTTDYHYDLSAEFATAFFSDAPQLGNVDGPCIVFNTSAVYNYANTVKAKLNAHMAKVDAVLPYNVWTHNVAADTTNTITGAAATTPHTLRALINEMLYSYSDHHDDADDGHFTYLSWHIMETNNNWYISPYFTRTFGAYSTNSYPDLFAGIGPANWSTALFWLGKIRTAFNGHVNDGLNPIAANKPHGTDYPGGVADKNSYLIPGTAPTFANYIYGFCWKIEYTVGTQTFIDRGPVLIVVPNYGAVGADTDVDEVRSASTISIEYEGQAISNLPVYSNLTGENYDTSNMYLEIYRTTDSGNVLYLVDAVLNGTTTYTDRVKDADLQTRERAYITGGVVDNDPPPIAKCMHIVNDKAYYGNILDGTERFSGQIRESIANDPDSVPADFSVDVNDEVKAISSYKSVPIVFGGTSHYRLEGGFDELGRGALTAQTISETIGTIANNSVVRTEYGVFFAGVDGFYVTDGYQTRKISKDWNHSYALWTVTTDQKFAITGAYDVLENRIWWTITTGGSVQNKCVILDLNYPLEPTPTWTSASGAGDDGGVSFSPSALMFVGPTMYRGDSDGFIFTHAKSYDPTDPRKDSTLAATAWGTQSILYDYQSCFMDFGTAVMRKWATWFHTQIKTETNLYAELQVRNESDGFDWEDMAPIQKLSDYIWGQPDLLWGDTEMLWNGGAKNFLAQKRAFPAGSLRFTYRQLRIKSGFQLLYASSAANGETVAVDAATKRVTLTGLTWPFEVTTYHLAFDVDAYALEFTISRVISTTVVEVLDPSGLLVTGAGYAFKIYGHSKTNEFNILDYQLTGMPTDKTQEAMR